MCQSRDASTYKAPDASGAFSMSIATSKRGDASLFFCLSSSASHQFHTSANILAPCLPMPVRSKLSKFNREKMTCCSSLFSKDGWKSPAIERAPFSPILFHDMSKCLHVQEPAESSIRAFFRPSAKLAKFSSKSTFRRSRCSKEGQLARAMEKAHSG